VNQLRHPLRINVGFLLNQSIGYYRDIHFEYPEIHLKPDLTLNDFSGVARVTRTPQGILVQGQFQGETPSECARCLIDFQQPLKSSFSELYAFDQRSLTDSGLLLPEDGNIELEELVREYLLIELPITPICSSDCKGLCLVCGQNLNEELCEHHRQELRES
jgi:uncharacterized protein